MLKGIQLIIIIYETTTLNAFLLVKEGETLLLFQMANSNYTLKRDN